MDPSGLSTKAAARTELSESEILEAAELLQALESHPGFTFLLERIDRVKQITVAAMERGQNLPQESYTRHMGFLSGTGIVRSIIETVHTEALRIREREIAETERRNEERARTETTGLFV